MDMNLEEKCNKCSGTGNYNEWGQSGQKRGHTNHPRKRETIVFSISEACPYCLGTGTSLTSFGTEIMEMVIRRLNAKPSPIPDID